MGVPHMTTNRERAEATGAGVTVVHICGGVNTRYQARARRMGHRKWVLIGQPTRVERIAIQRMSRAFAHHRDYKRADVIMCADYYDPIQVCELVRK